MASDFRMLQHDAAMATHSLAGAIEQLEELQRRHPEIVAAEYQDITAAWHKITSLLGRLDKQVA